MTKFFARSGHVLSRQLLMVAAIAVVTNRILGGPMPIWWLCIVGGFLLGGALSAAAWAWCRRRPPANPHP